jgi:hypothetical protein
MSRIGPERRESKLLLLESLKGQREEKRRQIADIDAKLRSAAEDKAGIAAGQEYSTTPQTTDSTQSGAPLSDPDDPLSDTSKTLGETIARMMASSADRLGQVKEFAKGYLHLLNKRFGEISDTFSGGTQKAAQDLKGTKDD